MSFFVPQAESKGPKLGSALDQFEWMHLLIPGKRLKPELKCLLGRKMSAQETAETNLNNSVVSARPLFVVEGCGPSEYVRIHAHRRLLERIRLEEVAPFEVMLTPRDLARRVNSSAGSQLK